MKRLLAMLLAVTMLAAMLCGCASGGTKEAQETQETQETEGAAEENVTETKKSATATGTPQEIAESLVGDSLDLSIYEVDKDEDSISYFSFGQSGTFPYEITISGLKLQFDGVTTYQDVLNAGWSSNMPETADASYRYINTLVGPEGEHFAVDLTNVKEEAIPIEETYVMGITAGIKDNSGFTFGSITEKSTISDVIKAIGTPYSVSYYENLGLELSFEDNTCDSKNSISFTFDRDGVMTELSVGYNAYNLI